MKYGIAAIAVFIASVGAQASSLIVYNAEDANTYSVDSAFNVNPDLSVAWVELTLWDGPQQPGFPGEDPGNDPRWSTLRLKLDRLQFLPQSNEIVLMSPNMSTVESVCAQYIPAHGLFYASVQPTQNCQLKAGFEIHQVNDGFEMEDQRFLVSTLSD